MTWQALASTATIAANSRLTYSSPAIYSVYGAMVATSGADLWDLKIMVPISVNEFLVANSSRGVWTGTNQFGNLACSPAPCFPSGLFTAELGALNGIAVFGQSSVADERWVGSNVFTTSSAFLCINSVRF